jgi:hypothetical protein
VVRMIRRRPKDKHWRDAARGLHEARLLIGSRGRRGGLIGAGCARWPLPHALSAKIEHVPGRGARRWLVRWLGGSRRVRVRGRELGRLTAELLSPQV